jgi:hypothetical protein
MRLRRLAEIPHRRDCDRGEFLIYISLSLVVNMRADVRYLPTFHDVVGWRAFQADQRRPAQDARADRRYGYGHRCLRCKYSRQNTRS